MAIANGKVKISGKCNISRNVSHCNTFEFIISTDAYPLHLQYLVKIFYLLKIFLDRLSS